LLLLLKGLWASSDCAGAQHATPENAREVQLSYAPWKARVGNTLNFQLHSAARGVHVFPPARPPACRQPAARGNRCHGAHSCRFAGSHAGVPAARAGSAGCSARVPGWEERRIRESGLQAAGSGYSGFSVHDQVRMGEGDAEGGESRAINRNISTTGQFELARKGIALH